MEVERKRRLAAVALALIIEDEEDFSEPKKACWMKPWMCRKDLGLHSQHFSELLVSDPNEYRRLLRVSQEQFLELLARVGPTIERQESVMRRAITHATRLQVTLRYLATGKLFLSTLWNFVDAKFFRLGHSSVNDLIAKTCTAVYEELKSDCLQIPKTKDDWHAVIKGFRENWQYPNCVGAMDQCCGVATPELE
ncbi:hypothetical protein HPB47_018229 [Ixodes persulcatus]|uniref:Uncharacterized protein n=1 Tax=Ixodes persulcatus TaxID=34615 RepID=A0AC60QLB4_IXOPE|nr:hypothetical protein HPB47_018229 [Ixodes persulcatus]